MIDVAHSEDPEDRGEGGILGVPGNEKRDLALIRRAANENWPVSSKIKRRAVRAASKRLDSSDDRASLAAVRALVAMDRANIAREKPSGDDNSQHLHQHVHMPTAIVIHDENFYGHSEADLLAESPPARIESVIEQQPEEGGSVRPAVGQNGHGASSGDSGARPEPGKPEGGH
jgi:hypothetical protein